MPLPDDELKILFTPTDAPVDAAGFIEACQLTLRALQAIDKTASKHGSETVVWEVVDTGHSSPMFLILGGRLVEKAKKVCTNAAQVLVDGLRHLDDANSTPSGFDDVALECASKLSGLFARGVRPRLISSRSDVQVTHDISQNASHAMKALRQAQLKAKGRYTEQGSIEGHISGLEEQRNSDKFTVVDELSGAKIPCYIASAQLEEQLRTGWKHRVSVHGEVTIDRETGRPVEVRVTDIQHLRERHQLPQMSDLHGIGITGGIEPSEYVRNLRDAE